MTGPVAQDTSNANPSNVGNGLGLTSGRTPKLIPLSVDCTVAQSVLIDLTQQQQRGQIGPIQTIFVNNSGNQSPVTIIPFAPLASIPLTLAGGEVGILPFFISGTAPKFTVNTTGGVVVPIGVLDVPLPAQVWQASGGFSFAGGALIVSDPILEALISNIGGSGPALDVNVITTVGGGGSGAHTVDSPWGYRGQLVGGTVSINQTLPASPAGKYWHITSINVSLTPDIQNGVGETQRLLIQNPDFATPSDIWDGECYIPAVAPVTPGAGLINVLDISGFDFESASPYGTLGSVPSVGWFGTSSTQGALIITLYGYLSATHT